MREFSLIGGIVILGIRGKLKSISKLSQIKIILNLSLYVNKEARIILLKYFGSNSGNLAKSNTIYPLNN
jgi:hypothetical protein